MPLKLFVGAVMQYVNGMPYSVRMEEARRQRRRKIKAGAMDPARLGIEGRLCQQPTSVGRPLDHIGRCGQDINNSGGHLTSEINQATTSRTWSRTLEVNISEKSKIRRADRSWLRRPRWTRTRARDIGVGHNTTHTLLRGRVK